MADQTSAACPNPRPQPERCLDLVVVLGMHRSGTSAITRGLQTLGVELGENLMPPDTITNVKGFWEDIDIYQLNLELLSHLGLEWHSVSPINEAHVDVLCDSGYLLKAVKLLRSKLLPDRIFGMKDPRIAMLIVFWQRVFQHCKLKVGYVISLRNPISVAHSLKNRDAFDFEKSYLLWLNHTLNSIVYTEKTTRAVVDFDLLLQNPLEQIERLAGLLKLRVNHESLACYKSGFLDSGLCHSNHQPEDLEIDSRILPLVGELYSLAREMSLANFEYDSPTDRISCLKSGSTNISPLLRYVDELDGILAARDEKLASLGQEIAEKDYQAGSLNQALEERGEQLATIRKTVVQQNGQLMNLKLAISKCDELKMEAELGKVEAKIALDTEKTLRAAEASARDLLAHYTIKHTVKSRLVAMFPIFFLRRAKTRREVRHMKRESTFDQKFYESQLPVGFKAHQPAVHYVVVGRKLGLKPHPKPPKKTRERTASQPQVAKPTTRVIFFSGEPHTPGHCYRIIMYAEAASLNGYVVSI